MPLLFHPLINAWFTETYGKPTPVQEEAWPLIAEGKNILALAPTGSGKTLTGFLGAISLFADGTYPASRLSVLYVSPLKSLNEDIRRNLLLPLEEIRKRFEKAGEPFPSVRVDTRSGDTPQSERRRFLSLPPSILALTPESLSIILLNPRGRQVLSTVRCVILDEIHTALGNKRGCFLSCQIDRLALVAGEFQRIALSATVNPVEEAADFTGGLRKIKNSSVYEKREVHIVAPADKKELEFQVVFPDGKEFKKAEHSGAERYGKRYTELIGFIIERIKANNNPSENRPGTVLVFTDSRRRVERITYLLNQTAESDPSGRPIERAGTSPLALAHHGSLSKEVRREVEKALAEGEVPCVVATGSLELGIDIGSVDEVILAGSPGFSAVALQRIGRSGHAVGMTSRGWLIPFHGMDLLQAAAVSGAIEDKELEETRCIENPLDILAQIVLALIVEKDWDEDDLYETVRGFYIYRNLTRSSFDRVVRMLAGAYEGTRLRELKRQIFRDDETKTLSATAGAQLLLYTSGGVIASSGNYSLRIAPNGSQADGTSKDGISSESGGAGIKIGELDEEFVWERRLGDCFDFGNRSWRITSISDEAVYAVPLPEGVDSTPFWRGETIYRSPVLSRRILEILDGYYPKAWTSIKAEKMLSRLSPDAREALGDFLHSQWSSQGGMPLPGPFFIPVEIIDDPENRRDSYLIIFYSFRGSSVNFPLSLALARDIESRYSLRVEGAADDNAVFLRLPRGIAEDPAAVIRDSLFRISTNEKGEERFRERLESSGIFGAAFREAAERSLILPRSPFGKRIPLWITRERSKRLFDAVSAYRDFPVSAEAWRTCLKEKFNMEAFLSFLEEIDSGALSVDFYKTRKPSPFSRELAWAETNVLMYQYDERPDLLFPASQNRQSLSDKVIEEALENAASRPRLKEELVRDFCSRLRREISGWAPEDAPTLCEWVKERVAIPSGSISCGDEWEKLLECIPVELACALREDNSLGGKLEYLRKEGAATGVVVHREWAKKWKESGAALLEQWLRYEGPIPISRIESVFGLSREEAENAVKALEEQGDLTCDVLVDSDELICDRENLELLLRLHRRKQRPSVKERPAAFLVPFLARRQGLLPAIANNAEENPWKNLAGISAPAKLWETEFFPCRSPSYSGEILDREIREGRLVWYGTGKEKTAFLRPEDLDLVLPVSPRPIFSGGSAPDFFDTPRSFWEIKDLIEGKGGAAPRGMHGAASAIWEEVWRGSLSADSWEPVRRALGTGFALPESDGKAADLSQGMGRRTLRVPRAIRERWRSGPPVSGSWFSLGSQESENLSPLEEEELNRERVRLLLNRWGILSRPLLEREVPLLSWSGLLPAIRRMELSGELVTGRFFSGVNSLQFASPRIAEELEEAETERGIYWMNAVDPASPAGLAVEGIIKCANSEKAASIRRISSSRLCFRGAELLAVSNKSGKEMEIFIAPDDPDIEKALGFIKTDRTRKVHPENKIIIEKINGKTAASTAYYSTLSALGFVRDRGRMVLW